MTTCLRAYMDSKGPDQPAHSRSLIRAFAVHNTESLDTIECLNEEQNAKMRLCVCVHFVHVGRHFFVWSDLYSCWMMSLLVYETWKEKEIKLQIKYIYQFDFNWFNVSIKWIAGEWQQSILLLFFFFDKMRGHPVNHSCDLIWQWAECI